MRVVIEQDVLHVRLSWWQKLLGLLRDIRVPLAEVSEVRVVEDALAPAIAAGIKVGLRLPYLYYVARTIRLDEAFIVRRGVPALSFAIHNDGTLRRVFISTPEAAELAERLAPSRPTDPPA